MKNEKAEPNCVKKSAYRFVNYCIVYLNRRQYIVTHCDESGTSYISPKRSLTRPASCHAEIKAIKLWFSKHYRSSKFRTLSRLTVYSLRAKLDRENRLIFGNGKPCYRCYQDLAYWNIRHIYYSNEDGEIVPCGDSDEYRWSSGDQRQLGLD